MSTTTVKNYTVEVFRNTEHNFNFGRVVKPGQQRDKYETMPSSILSMGQYDVEAPNGRSAIRRAKETVKRTARYDAYGQPIPEGFGYEFTHVTPEVRVIDTSLDYHGIHQQAQSLREEAMTTGKPIIVSFKKLTPEQEETFREGIKEFGPALERLSVTPTDFSAQEIQVAHAVSAKLGPTQQKILDWAGEWCKTHQGFTKSQVMDCLNLTDDSARKSLKRLVDAGLVTRTGDNYDLN